MHDLICAKHVKRYALDVAKRERNGWKPDRVSQKFLDGLNAKVRNIIFQAVKRHRSVGKTITDII